MSTPRRPARLLTDTRERVRRTPWPRRPPAAAPVSSEAKVAVVTVNFDTAALLARLLLSLHRVLAPGRVERIVVVDQGSTDGSRELLGALRAAGLVDVVDGRARPYHGPGLNRGVSYLARERRAGRLATDTVWILDSDVLVLRADALSTALDVFGSRHAVLLGQEQDYDQPRPQLSRYAHPAALLLDAPAVWRASVPAFLEDGAPGVMMQHVLQRRGLTVVDHPWFASGALLHVGGGTLGALRTHGHTTNRYYDWAAEHGAPHFHGAPDGARRWEQFRACFAAEVPELRGDVLVDACTRDEPIVLDDPA